MEIQKGRYKHFKGHTYKVIGLARHSETLEELVIYQNEDNDPKYGEHATWVRPKSMFFETVEKDGKQISRFQYLGD